MKFAISCTVDEAKVGHVMACITQNGGEDLEVSPIVEIDLPAPAPAKSARRVMGGSTLDKLRALVEGFKPGETIYYETMRPLGSKQVLSAAINTLLDEKLIVRRVRGEYVRKDVDTSKGTPKEAIIKYMNKFQGDVPVEDIRNALASYDLNNRQLGGWLSALVRQGKLECPQTGWYRRAL